MMVHEQYSCFFDFLREVVEKNFDYLRNPNNNKTGFQVTYNVAYEVLHELGVEDPSVEQVLDTRRFVISEFKKIKESRD
jgi:hypothetical protein